MHQAAGDLQPPAHAAGKAAHQFVGEFSKPHGFEKPRDDFLALRGGQPVELGVDHHIFARGQLGIGRERLGDHSDGVANAVGVLDHVVPGHYGLP